MHGQSDMIQQQYYHQQIIKILTRTEINGEATLQTWNGRLDILLIYLITYNIGNWRLFVLFCIVKFFKNILWLFIRLEQPICCYFVEKRMFVLGSFSLFRLLNKPSTLPPFRSSLLIDQILLNPSLHQQVKTIVNDRKQRNNWDLLNKISVFM